MSSGSRRRALGTLLVATVLGVGACGGGDGPSEPEMNPPGSETRVPTQLLVGVVGTPRSGEPFDVTVTLADAQGTAVPAEAATTVTLSVESGLGSLRGTTSGSVSAGATQATISDVIYDHAEGGVRLRATVTGGTGTGVTSASQPITLDFDFTTDLVAFRRTAGNSQDIYLMTSDGSAFLNLTDNPSGDTDPAWSPDGSRIAFVSTRSGNADLWVVDVESGDLTQVTDNQGSVRFPQWSPDGTMIAYSANVNDQRDIYVIGAPPMASSALANSSFSAQAPIQVTDNPATDNEPVWSPDGLEIFFFSNRDSDGAIWSIDFDGMIGSDPANLTIDFVFACAPGSGWSLVDGRVKLSFVGETDDQLDIWTMDLDGSNQMNVTDHPADEFYSSWMGDGAPSGASGSHAGSPSSASSQSQTRLVFDSNRDGDWQLYSISEDGSDVVRLTDYSSDDEMPRWRPALD